MDTLPENKTNPFKCFDSEDENWCYANEIDFNFISGVLALHVSGNLRIT